MEAHLGRGMGGRESESWMWAEFFCLLRFSGAPNYQPFSELVETDYTASLGLTPGGSVGEGGRDAIGGSHRALRWQNTNSSPPGQIGGGKRRRFAHRFDHPIPQYSHQNYVRAHNLKRKYA